MTHDAAVNRFHRTGGSTAVGWPGKDLAPTPASLGTQNIEARQAGGEGQDRGSDGRGPGVRRGDDATERNEDTDTKSKAHWSEKAIGFYTSATLLIIGLVWLVWLLMSGCGATGQAVVHDVSSCVAGSVDTCALPADITSGDQWATYGLCLAKTAAPCVATVGLQQIGGGQMLGGCDTAAAWPTVEACVADRGCWGDGHCQQAAQSCWEAACETD